MRVRMRRVNGVLRLSSMKYCSCPFSARRRQGTLRSSSGKSSGINELRHRLVGEGLVGVLVEQVAHTQAEIEAIEQFLLFQFRLAIA
jgi:hypothetical protein